MLCESTLFYSNLILLGPFSSDSMDEFVLITLFLFGRLCGSCALGLRVKGLKAVVLFIKFTDVLSF